MSYVKVLFPESRDVYIDDEWQGSNRAASGRPRAFYVNAAQHTFSLGGAADVDPDKQVVDVPERPILDPFPVEFKKC